MEILIDSGSYDCRNAGDLAMLQTGVARLRELWPEAVIRAVTRAPAVLALRCPGVQPVPLAGRIAFVTDRFFGRADRILPQRLTDTLHMAEDHLRQRSPASLASVIAWKRALTLRQDHAAPRAYVDALRRSDLVVVTGAGMFTDDFIENAVGVMATLELAIGWNITTAMLGQGFGPVSVDALRRRMRQVLPFVNLIAVREQLKSLQLLESVGVSPDRIVVTGDDAIEISNRSATTDPGSAIGVNIRVASYSRVDVSAIATISSVLQVASARLGARLLPVPISHQKDRSDLEAIKQLISGSASIAPSPAELEEPASVIAQVSRCRIVVTGSYHAAVFALAQGIPVVAMVAAPYYRDKFAGLADLFGGGCEIVYFDAPDVRAALHGAIDRTWQNAPQWREPLLRAARAQIESGKSAYRRLGTLVRARNARRPTGSFTMGESIEMVGAPPRAL